MKETFENRADLMPGDASTTENTCDFCDDPLVFAMKDRYHSFSLGLTTVLECLRLAEQQGHVPPLPPDWWIIISTRYEQLRRL